MKDFYFIKKWKEEMIHKIHLVHPEWSDKNIDHYLEIIISKRFKDSKCKVRNTYKNIEAKSTLLNMTQFIHDRKPILGGYGVMYLNQEKVYNPAAHMLTDSINKRKGLKKERKKYDKRSYEFLQYDIAQSNEKVIANSFYGANGTPTSTFYNKDLASSITSCGQSEIATAETSFESLLANNVKFLSMDDMMLFVYRIKKQKFIHKIPKKDNIRYLLANRLYNDIKNPAANADKELIKLIVSNLTEEECTKVYYKNNLIEFFKDHKPSYKILHKLINKTKSFRDPNRIPEDIMDDLNTLWDYIEEFVVYNYTPRNRIERDKYDMRKVCIVQDTDSTMITLKNLMEFMVDEYAEDEVAAETDSDFEFILVNIICTLLTKYSKLFFDRYCTDVNIPQEYHPLINMKNEFYYPMLLDTSNRKSYVTLTKLQEGVEIKPPKIEIHGLGIVKSDTSDMTRDFFNGILKEDIMYADDIDVSKIISKVRRFQLVIKESLMKGELSFLPIKSIKEPAAYKEPYKEQGIRAALIWNVLYPDIAIHLPDKFYLLKINCDKRKDFDEMEIPFKYRDILITKIYGSQYKSVVKGGFNVIAIPQTVTRIPEWIIPLINYDAIIKDNVSKFDPVLKSLGVIQLKTRSNSNHMSNLITF